MPSAATHLGKIQCFDGRDRIRQLNHRQIIGIFPQIPISLIHKYC
ncbi:MULTISPECIES: hypothetical protein [Cyanophyceae]|nr:hypothetical protein [Trichocoleus sp. FACHB-40]